MLTEKGSRTVEGEAMSSCLISNSGVNIYFIINIACLVAYCLVVMAMHNDMEHRLVCE